MGDLHQFFSVGEFNVQSVTDMSLALETICGALGLPFIKSPQTQAVADQIMELARRGVAGEEALRFMALRYLDDVE
jgi:hypothetical protein